MRYYILYPGDTEADTVKDTNQLGDDNGFGVFWIATGLQDLVGHIAKEDPIIQEVIIKDESGTSYNIHDFLDKLKSLEVRVQE